MLLALEDVTVHGAAGEKILDGISLSVREHEFLGITGRSGSGKTTLLETAGGLRDVASGRILFRGEDIRAAGADRTAFRRGLQIVFQFPENQFFESDVRSEIAFGPKMLKIPETEIQIRTEHALNAVGLNREELLNRSAFALSGGQKRRLALACALTVGPDVLLLDEPFTGLDAEGQELLTGTLKNLHAEGMTIMMVSHDADTLCELSDRLIVLSGRKIVTEGTPDEIYRDTEVCSRLGIGRPAFMQAAEKIGLDLIDVNNYAQFLDVLKSKFGRRIS